MGATLALSLTNAAGADLNDFVRIGLTSAQDSNRYRNEQHVSRDIIIRGVAAGPRTLYRVVLAPSNYRLVQFFVNLEDRRITRQTVAVPIDPARVAGLKAPDYDALDAATRRMLEDSEIPRFLNPSGAYRQGADLYRELESLPRVQACFLNIAAKSAATPLRDGSNCLAHYGGMVRMEQDRVFVRATAALREEVQSSPLFHSVSPALHDPVPGYAITDSYKTLDRYGNLQLTFQRHVRNGSYAADIDLDDGQGIEHVFQVLRNAVSGPTDPYDIHDILVKEQGIDPGYEFVFRRAAAAG